MFREVFAECSADLAKHPKMLSIALRRRQPFSFGRWQLLTCTIPLLPAERFEVGMLASTLWIRRQYLPLVRFLIHATCGSHASRSHIHQSPRDFLSSRAITIFCALLQFLFYKEWFSVVLMAIVIVKNALLLLLVA